MHWSAPTAANIFTTPSIAVPDSNEASVLDNKAATSDELNIPPPRLRPYTQLNGSLPSAIDRASETREQLAASANTAIPLECRGLPPSLTAVVCEIRRLPLAIARVATAPMFGLSPTGDESDSFRLASIENYAWLVVYLWVALTLLRRKSANALLTSAFLLYTLLVFLGLGVFGGNIGTAFRHKAQALPFLLLIIALSNNEYTRVWRYFRRRTVSEKPNA